MERYCPTPHALLLVAYPDAKGIFQVLGVKEGELPGIGFEVQGGSPIALQLYHAMEQRVGAHIPRARCRILENIELPVTEGEKSYTLYALLLGQAPQGPEKTVSFAQLLREMPSTRVRIAYLKIWQVLAGVLEQEIHVVDTPEGTGN
jgi:hypothetical protein